MKFYSIKSPAGRVTLREAVLRSVVDISDLYMPESFPLMPDSFIRNLKGMSLKDIALQVSLSFLGEDIPSEKLDGIVSEALTFDIPLKKLDDNLFVLELFHGPTLAFKDVGARFMAGLFEYLNRDEKNEITVMAATSGDTGSAVASAFYNREGIRVIILYPSGRVSAIQEKQLTTMGGNIIALEVEGTFDDCQGLVKQAFADKDLNEKMVLTSANSINFARLFPQMFYYFYAYAQFDDVGSPLVFSVPSGNFGNLTAGLFSKRTGLPVHRFIASTNINRSVPDYLNTGIFMPEATRHTITNAMDVGNPGNFPRILELYHNDIGRLRSDLAGYWFTDYLTVNGMAELMKEYDYQSDPHGAVAFLGLKEFMKTNDCTGVFLETAHPVKFPEVVYQASGKVPEEPAGISDIMKLEKRSVRIQNSYHDLKSYLTGSG